MKATTAAQSRVARGMVRSAKRLVGPAAFGKTLLVDEQVGKLGKLIFNFME
jgi:hypothetical protein